jgi:ketosteroid isomerase-like protein
VGPEPLRKDHITDWITSARSNGETLKSYDLERLSIQVPGNLATTTYRIRQRWVDKGGIDHPSVLRIIHTWLRDTTGSWRIISGMSAPTSAEAN